MSEIIKKGTMGVKHYRWDLGDYYDEYTQFSARFKLEEEYGDSVLVTIIQILNVLPDSEEFRDILPKFGIKSLGETTIIKKEGVNWVLPDNREPEDTIITAKDIVDLLDTGSFKKKDVELKLDESFKINELMDLIIERI
jgi:hypothetical protein